MSERGTGDNWAYILQERGQIRHLISMVFKFHALAIISDNGIS